MCSELERGYTLNADQVRQLDKIIRTGWRRWVDGLPSWLSDDWLIQRGPVAILKKYGQDLPYGRPADQAQEESIFEDECKYSNIRYYSFAVATPIR
jgi:hypothetical protein